MEKHSFRRWWKDLEGRPWLRVRRDTWRTPRWQQLRFSGKLAELGWYLRGKFWYHYNRVQVTTLSPTWCDRDTLLLHAAFQILVEYVEKEKPYDFIAWECEDHIDDYQEVFTLYDWWINVRPAREDPTDWWVAQCAQVGLSHDVTFGDPTPAGTRRIIFGPEQSEVRGRLAVQSAEMENAQANEDDDMLCRLVRIRSCLWT